jgi:hypothetical protein
MKWLSRGRGPTYHDVGWPIPGERRHVFSQLSIPGAKMRLLDRHVHSKGMAKADQKLQELLHRSGRRTSL